MRWIKAEHKDLVDMGNKHWRCAKTKAPIFSGTAFTWVRDGRNEVEWLDESESSSPLPLKDEIERLKGLIEDLYFSSGGNSFVTHQEEWKAYKIEHNL